MSMEMTTGQRFAAAFAKIAAIIRTETHNDASIIRTIVAMVPVNAVFGYTFGSAVADVLDEQTGEIDYTEVVVEAYRRTLFDLTTIQRYGLDYFGGDPQKAEEFARAMELLYRNESLQLIANASRYLN